MKTTNRTTYEARHPARDTGRWKAGAIIALGLWTMPAMAQDVLPFPAPPMGGKVAPTMQESVHKWREATRPLPADAPNILIVMLDDAGFGQPSTFGGEIETPTMSRLANEGGPVLTT